MSSLIGRPLADLETPQLLIDLNIVDANVRRLQNAVKDRGINIRVHFKSLKCAGLARYLQGDFEGARGAYRECLAVSKNPDMLVATSHWLYTTLRRLGQDEEAARVLEPIHAGLDVIENRAYHRLLLLYRGELTADALLAEAGGAGSLDFATVAYGVAAWHLYHGREAEANALFQRIVSGGEWPAFGHLAAEAELARRPPAGRLGAGPGLL